MASNHRPETPRGFVSAGSPGLKHASVSLLYRPVAQIPLIRSRPDREHKLLHDVLQPQFVSQIIKVEFHGPTTLTPSKTPSNSSFASYVATSMPFHNPLTAHALLGEKCHPGIRITHRLGTKMACRPLFGQGWICRPGPTGSSGWERA